MNGNGFKFDWKLPVFLTVLNLGGIAVGWGARDAKMEELYRAKEQQERHLEFIDNELNTMRYDAGAVKEFRTDVDRRLSDLNTKVDELRKR